MDNYLLTIIGSYVDTYYEVKQYPEEGDFTHTTFIGTSAGGAPFNVGAVAASKGVNVKTLDMLGKQDDTTKFILDECKRLKINTDNIQIKDNVTNGKIIIFNSNKNRTMFLVDPIRPTYVVDEKMQELLNNATYIYTLQHVINRSFDSIEPLLEAKRKGAKILIDGSSKYDDPDKVKQLYQLVDGLFINETNYERLKCASEFDPIEKIISKDGFVCITNGSVGATLYTNKQTIFEAALKVNVVDTTGAGDGFPGGFISCLLKGLDYAAALKVATINGAYACTIQGGLGGVCSIDELERFSKENGYGSI